MSDRQGIERLLENCPELAPAWAACRQAIEDDSIGEGMLAYVFWSYVIGPYLQHALPSDSDSPGHRIVAGSFASRGYWSNLPTRGPELDELTERLFQVIDQWAEAPGSGFEICVYSQLCDEPNAGIATDDLLGFAGPSLRSLKDKARRNASTWRNALSKRESVIAGECLRAAADGPFFPDWEFSTLFGFERPEIRSFADSWPDATDVLAKRRAVKASMNNLVGYPHRLDDEWARWVPVSRSRVEELLRKIAKPAIP
jgi:hypothetical protein